MKGHGLADGRGERETAKGFEGEGRGAGERGLSCMRRAFRVNSWPYNHILERARAERLSAPNMDRVGHQDHHRKRVWPKQYRNKHRDTYYRDASLKKTIRGFDRSSTSFIAMFADPPMLLYTPLGPTRPLLGRIHTCLMSLTSASKSAGFAMITLPVCVKKPERHATRQGQAAP